MSEIKINNIPVITENNGSVELTTDTANIGNELTTDTANIGNNALVVDAGGNVGVGTSSPGAKLHIVDDDNAGWLYYQYNIADGTNFRNYRARGTIDAPEAILANDRLASFLAGGYGVTNSSSGFSGPNGGISIHAAENFTNSSAGTYVVLQTSETGTNPAGGGVERMRINSSGYVTKPYQPAFEARTHDNGTNGGYYPSAGQVEVVTPYVNVTNIGNHFDLQNNRFTAPISGMYVIGFNFYYSPASGNYIGGVINISTGRYIYAFSSPGTDVNATYSTCIYLNQNDWVRFLTYCGDSSSRLYNSSTVYGYFLG